MSWAMLFTLAGVVFFSRYLFLEPRLPVRLPHIIRQALSYAAPCLLTAICGPIIMMEEDALRSFPDNPYLWGTLISIALALAIKSTLLVVILSMAFFYLLVFIV